MNRIAILFGLGLILVTSASASASDPLLVTAVVGPKPYFVGQGIEIRVEVAGAESPSALDLDPPRVAGAEVFRLAADPSRPTVSRFAVVPARAGILEIPPFRARSGDRPGASRPIKLSVSNLPIEGRTPAFLGGVGPFDVRSELATTRVRVGETLEIRFVMSGMAALGSVRAPSLDEWKSPTLKVERRGDRVDLGEIPVRTFAFGLRPSKAGSLRLPPIAVAAFDPTTRWYATRTTSSLTLRVDEPPPFDPTSLGDPTVSAPRPSPSAITIALGIGGLAVVSGSLLVARALARARRGARRIDPRRLARELAAGLSDESAPVETARALAEALTTYLHRVGGRSPGVLTPAEARFEFERLTSNPSLSASAEALMVRCDRVRFGTECGDSSEFVSEGRRFFEELGGVAIREEQKPGEAAETASGV